MELRKVQRACHGRSAMAIYAFRHFKLNIYVRHNVPCKKDYGDFYLSAYINPNNGNTGTEHGFNNYLDFVKFRGQLATDELK